MSGMGGTLSDRLHPRQGVLRLEIDGDRAPSLGLGEPLWDAVHGKHGGRGAAGLRGELLHGGHGEQSHRATAHHRDDGPRVKGTIRAEASLPRGKECRGEDIAQEHRRGEGPVHVHRHIIHDREGGRGRRASVSGAKG